MAATVLDTSAVIAFFKGEPGADAVEALMRQAIDDKARLLLCVVTWGEIYHGAWRAGGREAAEALAGDLSRLPVELVEADLALSRQAAIFKATHKIPYAGCFAAALAKQNNCELLTGDPQFKEVENEIQISWLK